MIKQIMEAVSIPVMAKVRIGHIVEAQILQSIGVDYIDVRTAFPALVGTYLNSQCVFWPAPLTVSFLWLRRNPKSLLLPMTSTILVNTLIKFRLCVAARILERLYGGSQKVLRESLSQHTF